MEPLHIRFSLVIPISVVNRSPWSIQAALRRNGLGFLHRKWAGSVIALAGDLDFAGSGFFTGLSTVFVSALHKAKAWNMRTLDGQIRCHDGFPLSRSLASENLANS